MTTLARGIALFLGGYSLLDLISSLLGTGFAANTFWIDLRVVSTPFATLVGVSGTLGLLCYAVAPTMSHGRRLVTAGATIALAVVAALNAAGFWRAWQSGGVAPWCPVPLSALIAVALLAVAVHMNSDTGTRRPTRFASWATVAVAVLLALVFPLAQVFFFGTTDYARAADVAVVFGAKVHADGRLSSSLEDRVRTAVRLYEDGYVERLIMSGGVGATGVDEAVAMKRRAVELGVPAQAIDTDSQGVDTDATVTDTLRMLGGAGHARILVVSQFYHLPRIKMAYAAAGQDVYTVPATARAPIGKTPLFVAREVPGFWVYWARSWLRDTLG